MSTGGAGGQNPPPPEHRARRKEGYLLGMAWTITGSRERVSNRISGTVYTIRFNGKGHLILASPPKCMHKNQRHSQLVGGPGGAKPTPAKSIVPEDRSVFV
jgi:hypothetical protein